MSEINARIDRQLKDYYFQGCKADGECLFCGKSGMETTKDKRGKVWPLFQYHVLWDKVSWFRGDDEIVGKVCTVCKKNFNVLMREKLQKDLAPRADEGSV